jgi:hypothetical protein
VHKAVYRSAVLILALSFVSLGFSAPAVAADAPTVAPTAAGTALGIDVSWPQCNVTPPADYSFVTVGLNRGRANDSNECSATQLLLSQGANSTAPKPQASIYINTGNPGLAANWWPASNTTQDGHVTVSNPRGTCAHKAGAACAFVYGYSMARDDVLIRGANGGAVANPTDYLWWLDVETGNTWSTDVSANTASLEGMYAYLHGIGADVGLYSTAHQWSTIAGATSSRATIAGLPSWLAGASSATTAKTACTSHGLTPGSVVTQVQFVSAAVDYDVFCAPFAPAPTPALTGLGAIGHTLTSTAGTWQSGAKLVDQWLRDGRAISGATSHLHTITSSDAGHTLAMRITATEAGFATTVRTSSGVLVGRKLTATPVPTITGTFAAGHTLTANRGTWGPRPVTLSYQWKRDGVPIVGATGKTYLLQSSDAGRSVSVVVTGSKTGYTTVSKGSAAHRIHT